MRVLIPIVSVVAALYAAACVLLYLGQRSLLYYPTPATAFAGLTPMALESEGETLRIWKVGDSDVPGRPAIIYFGGNAEDVASNIPLFQRSFPLHAVYLVNYRGYGGSTGSPSEAALFADALKVFDSVHAGHAEVSVIGRSLGSGVAVYLAGQRKVRRLVLVTPYDSIASVASRAYPMFPVSWLLKDKFASDTRIGAVNVPILALVAGNDEVIPRASSEALIALIPNSQIKTVVVPGAAHNTIDGFELYAESLRSFLE